MLNRIGESNFNKLGSKMTIVKYNTYHDITVEFENGHRKETTYNYFKKGNVRSPYDKTVYGIGYIGVGKHIAQIEGKGTKKYDVWFSMMRRCYDFKAQKRHPTYIGCIVDEEWHNFQVFGDWYDENYYELGNERMDLEKDILIKGNKVYSENTCVFSPTRINTLFGTKKRKESTLPIGVTFKKGKFIAQCHYNGVKSHLGSFDSPQEAFNTYKNYKEIIMKDIADEYLGKIPMKLYRALIAYEIEIND